MAEPKKMVLKKGKEEKITSKKELPKVNRMEKAKKFLRGVKSELKKVHWPDRKQLVAYTGVTLVTVLIIASILWIFDSLLSWLLGLFF